MYSVHILQHLPFLVGHSSLFYTFASCCQVSCKTCVQCVYCICVCILVFVSKGSCPIFFCQRNLGFCPNRLDKFKTLEGALLYASSYSQVKTSTLYTLHDNKKWNLIKIVKIGKGVNTWQLQRLHLTHLLYKMFGILKLFLQRDLGSLHDHCGRIYDDRKEGRDAFWESLRNKIHLSATDHSTNTPGTHLSSCFPPSCSNCNEWW